MTNVTLDFKSKTTLQSDGTVRFQGWIDSAVNAPAEVFLIRLLPLSPGSTRSQVNFARPCNYSDLLNYSTSSDAYREYFRVSALDYLFTSIKEAQTFEGEMQDGVDNLAKDILFCTDTVPVVTNTDIAAALNMATSIVDGGTGYCKKVTITLSPKGAYTESNFFLVKKLTNASPAPVDNQELHGIASPEDLLMYTATEQYPGYYRMNTLTFACDSTDKVTTVVNAIKADLTASVTAYKTPLSSPKDYSVSQTLTNTPLYGN